MDPIRKTLLVVALVLPSIFAFSQEVIPFADPYILVEDGVYYMYGTSSDNGIGVLTSTDLMTWRVPEGKDFWFALRKEDSYGNKWFWAPEVYHIGDSFYMFYSAEEHICAAKASSPLGPFVQEKHEPMLKGKGIDNSMFIDEDGKAYIFWVHFNGGNETWCAELEDDYMHIKPGTERFCISMSQKWEKVWPSVNEGPFVVKHNGTYYLTYSANSYESPFYGVGYATCKDLGKKWKKYRGNPILQNPGELTGVGHHSLFKDFDGNNRIVFHSHYAPGKIGPRIIHISTWGFTGKGVMTVSDSDIITPSLSRNH